MTESRPPRVLQLTTRNPDFRDDTYAMLAYLASNPPVMWNE
jgi:hypothetical protein